MQSTRQSISVHLPDRDDDRNCNQQSMTIRPVAVECLRFCLGDGFDRCFASRRTPYLAHLEPSSSAQPFCAVGNKFRHHAKGAEVHDRLNVLPWHRSNFADWTKFLGNPMADNRFRRLPHVKLWIELSAPPLQPQPWFSATRSIAAGFSCRNSSVTSNSNVNSLAIDTVSADCPWIGSPMARMAWAKLATS